MLPTPASPPSPLYGAHWLKSVLQLPRMKSHARGCPTTLLAMLLMVEVASCLRILVGSTVYCRYLGGQRQVRGQPGQSHSTHPGPRTHRLRIQGWGLQVRAVRSLSASDTMVASRNRSQMKSQASSPPVATMLQ